MIALFAAAAALAASVDAPRICATSQRLADRPEGWTSPARALPDHRDIPVKQVRDAGADLLVVGSGIFASEDLTQAYRGLVEALA